MKSDSEFLQLIQDYSIGEKCLKCLKWITGEPDTYFTWNDLIQTIRDSYWKFETWQQVGYATACRSLYSKCSFIHLWKWYLDKNITCNDVVLWNLV